MRVASHTHFHMPYGAGPASQMRNFDHVTSHKGEHLTGYALLWRMAAKKRGADKSEVTSTYIKLRKWHRFRVSGGYVT